MREKSALAVDNLDALPTHFREESFTVRSTLRRCDADLSCPMLSVKAVLHGEELYEFADRTIRLRAGQFLVVARGAEYRARIRTSHATIGQCIYFANDANIEAPPPLAPFDLDDLTPAWRGWTADTGAEVIEAPLRRWVAALHDESRHLPRGNLARSAILLRGLRRARRVIDARFDEALTVPALAAEAGLSTGAFARAFRAVFGESPARCVETVRLAAARDAMRDVDRPLTEIAVSCGYSDLPTFSKAFRRRFGTAPSRLRMLEQESTSPRATTVGASVHSPERVPNGQTPAARRRPGHVRPAR